MKSGQLTAVVAAMNAGGIDMFAKINPLVADILAEEWLQ